MDFIYLVTEYYNNGEIYEDYYSKEDPITFFENKERAINYCIENGGKKQDLITDKRYLTYKIKEVKEKMECPMKLEYTICDEDYSVIDEEYCNSCFDFNFSYDNNYDYSWREFRIYKIERM